MNTYVGVCLHVRAYLDTSVAFVGCMHAWVIPARSTCFEDNHEYLHRWVGTFKCEDLSLGTSMQGGLR